ncbi:MAG: DNA-binding protein, partial [Acidimicrobiales bacterium]|nr:DNA-binding protein [Acidimicrobiales bacterium]
MQLVLAGDVAVVDDAGARHVVQGRQPRTCVVLLGLDRRRTATRGELADALWGDDLSPHWEGALRGVVAKVRRYLTDAGLPASALRIDHGLVRLDLPPDMDVDLGLAAGELAAAEAAAGAQDPIGAIAHANRALSTLRAELAPGVTGSWLDQHRHAHAALARRALLLAADTATGADQADEAVSFAEEVLAQDPFD